jgi:hypothetical protein
MSSHVVEEMFAPLHGGFGGICLEACQFVECDGDGRICGATVIEETSDDLLDQFNAILVQRRAVVFGEAFLSLSAVLDWRQFPQAMHWFGAHGVFVFQELFFNVARH